MSDHDDVRLYRPAEAAEMIGTTITRVKALARADAVQHVRLGGRREIRFTRDQIRSLTAHLTDSGAPDRSTPGRAPGLDLDGEAAALALLRGVTPVRR